MDVSSVSTGQTTVGTTATPSTTSALGKDEFLKLLSVELQNQDPLSPVQNEDMLAQLAQFSSLEQLENMNANMQNSLDLNLLLTQVLNNTAAAGLVGKTVVASTSEINLESSGSATVGVDLGSAAQSVVMTIKDESGFTVRTIDAGELAAGRNEISWDGKDVDGTRVAAGTYSIEIKAVDSDGNAVTASTVTTGEVTSVKFKDGVAYLVVDGQEIAISDVLEITT